MQHNNMDTMEQNTREMNLAYTPYTEVVYRLTGYMISEGRNATYPLFKIHDSETSIHASLESAQKRMNSIIEQKDNGSHIWHSFIIDEIPLGVSCGMYEYQKRWSYTSDGTFVAESACSLIDDADRNYDHFQGRYSKDLLFKPGDIVEVKSHCWASLGIIQALPAIIEEGEEDDRVIYGGNDVYYILDFADPDYAMEREVVDCLPARTLPLDEEVKARLEEIYRNYNR